LTFPLKSVICEKLIIDMPATVVDGIYIHRKDAKIAKRIQRKTGDAI
jgi:hypothetical protein